MDNSLAAGCGCVLLYLSLDLSSFVSFNACLSFSLSSNVKSCILDGEMVVWDNDSDSFM